MTRLFLTRRWILLTFALVFFLTGFIVAGFWQLGRYHERRAQNATQTGHIALPEAPLEQVLATHDPATHVKADTYRRVTVTGTYDVKHEIVFISRSFDGISGNELLTPLVDARGEAIIVDRGWVPIQDDQPGPADSLPPTGTVTVHGVLLQSQRRGLWGPKIPATGYISQTLRIDVLRLSRQLPYPVYPMYLLLTSQQPAQAGALPKQVVLPGPDAGPFLSYTIQWFCFALIAIATYLALAWRTIVRAREMREEGAPALEDART